MQHSLDKGHVQVTPAAVTTPGSIVAVHAVPNRIHCSSGSSSSGRRHDLHTIIRAVLTHLRRFGGDGRDQDVLQRLTGVCVYADRLIE